MSELEIIEIGDPFEKPIKQFEKPIKERTFFEKAFPYLIFIGLGFVVLAIGLTAYYEFYTPSEFCNSVDLKHKIIFFPLPPTHFCGNSKIAQYTDGWDYPRPEFISNPY